MNFQSAINDYRSSSSTHRTEKRELWSKIILLSSVILGFSVTIYSTDYSVAINLYLLKIGWVIFLINILCGLFLLKKESEFKQEQILANLAQEWDKTEINIPMKTQTDKDKFLALIYLHGLRTTPKKENPFSQYATDIFKKEKKSLTSWKMIKNPEKFYTYDDMRKINVASSVFYWSFVLGMAFLVFAVIV